MCALLLKLTSYYSLVTHLWPFCHTLVNNLSPYCDQPVIYLCAYSYLLVTVYI